MSEARSTKDVTDLLEDIARKIQTDPEWGAGRPSHEEGGVTIVPPAEAPSIGAIDCFADQQAVTVTAETRNADAASVKVTLADDRLFIGLGEGTQAVRKDIRLPAPVDEEAAVATFRNGVLDVVLPIRRPKKSA
jgi:hypothetical protein